MQTSTAHPDLFLPIRDPDIDALHAATACYTTDPVVDAVLDLAGWPPVRGRLLDPGAGDGAFLERAIARLNVPLNDVDALADRVEGWEIHPDAAHDARIRITRHLEHRGWHSASAKLAADRIIIEADFLAPGPIERRYSVICGNPPFFRRANLPERFKLLYAETVPEYARADILHSFLDRCTEVLTDDGVLACVTSDRWLFNQNASKLRESIGRRFGIVELTRLDPASSFYRPKQRTRGTPPRIHPVAVLLGGDARTTRPLTREPIEIDGPMTLAPGTVTLGSVAEVRIAPWLGPQGVFFLRTSEASHLPPHELVPCVDTDDVTKEDTLRTPARVALRTQRGSEPDSAVLAHLDSTLGALPPRARQTPRWAPPENWGPFPLDREALLIPRIAQRLRVIRLPAGVLPINHNLSVVATEAGIPLDVLAVALVSDEAQAWIRQHAPRLENGYLSITTKLLRRLPVRIPTAS